MESCRRRRSSLTFINYERKNFVITSFNLKLNKHERKKETQERQEGQEQRSMG
jgi:hypothetical protein